MKITEQANKYTEDIDLMPIQQILQLMNMEDYSAVTAVQRALPTIEKVINFIVEHFPKGGRIFYIGAGSSGRVGAMDAAECPPTFGVSPDRIVTILAGGKDILYSAQESVEDSSEDGGTEVKKYHPTSNDCFIGIAASGRTPFVLAALEEAKKENAFCVMLSANPVELSKYPYIDIAIETITGEEVLTGSTRLKATTAFKLVLNMISTASMLKLGKTYGNRMCYIKPSNSKLANRVCVTLSHCCGITMEEAEKLLKDAENNMALALTMGLSGADKEKAQAALIKQDGRIREAVKMLS